jgi:hypothetical protein
LGNSNPKGVIMFNVFKTHKAQEVKPGEFRSLLQVIDNTSHMKATPGKLAPGVRSQERKEYEIFLQEIPDWWTVAAGKILSAEFFPLEDRQQYFVGKGVSEIGSVMTNQKFKMMTHEGYRTFWVEENGTINQE